MADAIISPPDFAMSVDENTVHTGSTAYFVDAQRIGESIRHLYGAPYASGSVMLAIGGNSKRVLASGFDDLVLTVRRSMACRSLIVDFLVDGPANTSNTMTVSYGSATATVQVEGTGGESHNGIGWLRVELEIGDGTLATHDRTDTTPTNDLVFAYGTGTAVWLYAVAWTELHNEVIST